MEAAMKGGYLGKLLFVDLSKGAAETQELADGLARNFIGGYGIGARVLYDRMKGGADPLGPDNILGFVTGPLTGTGALFGSRYMIVHKSPVTGGWNDANSGGHFGPELKKAGFDAVFVSGVAKEPVYLWIQDGKAEIRDARKLWGQDSVETVATLIAETGEKNLRASVIGPAGEKLSPMACPINDTHRAPGRGGGGAVMGSKNLKAVVALGRGHIPVADPHALRAANRAITAHMKTDAMSQMFVGVFSEYGTGAGTAMSALSGDSPVKNWGGVGVVDFGEEAATQVSCPTFDAQYKTKKYACAFCPVGCGAKYKVDRGKWPVGATDRPEYETMAAFGSMCLNSDVDSIIKCNHICNRAGLDTISMGCTVAWAIECYENGLLTRADTGGIELKWGNADSIVAITQAIADQEGLGKILALGSARAAKRLGKGAQYLNTVGGIEVPMHDPKIGPGLARTYQYDPTPARHVKGGVGLAQLQNPDPVKYSPTPDPFSDMKMTAACEVLNAAGMCMFGSFAMPQDALARCMEAVTGWSFDSQEQLRAGIRIMNMRHAFNLREGLTPADWVLPPRVVGEPPQTAGPLAGITIAHGALADGFFSAMGWDPVTGKISRNILELLGGMDDVVHDQDSRYASA
jgi:aldehyde:ferredoxin oxidoreductase